MDGSFSIFQDKGGIPYIKHYYVLDFTTACFRTIAEMVG